MLAIAAAVLFAIVQAQAAQAAAEKAAAARRRAAAALAAKAQADDASEEALAELEVVRGAAAKAVSDAQKIAEAAIQEAIADRDRILAERAADMHEEIDRVKADAQAQAAKTEAEQLVKSMHGEFASATAVTGAETEKANAERVDEQGQEATMTQQRAQAGLAASRARGPSGHRKSKMTPELVDEAQRMYNSRRFTVAEIAQACAVSPTTIYRHIRTGQNTTH
jgi:hypothetical protein